MSHLGFRAALSWILYTLGRLAHAPAQESSARSARFIVQASGAPQAPSGAAGYAGAPTSRHRPLLTELERGSVGRRFYKHGAPNGAFADGGNCETPGLNPGRGGGARRAALKSGGRSPERPCSTDVLFFEGPDAVAQLGGAFELLPVDRALELMLQFLEFGERAVLLDLSGHFAQPA